MKDFKKCRGEGKAKGYGCGELVPQVYYGERNRTYGIGRSCGCYQKWLRETPEGQEKVQNAIFKASKPRKDLEKLEKEHKERKGITTLINAVKDVCHEYIRARDYGKPCVSCGTPYKSDFDAGHYYKAELFSTLKFHENNIHGQCIYCNRTLEGNLNLYEIQLPKRIGEEAFEDLKHLARMEKRNSDFRWDREELKQIRNYYRTKLKSL